MSLILTILASCASFVGVLIHNLILSAVAFIVVVCGAVLQYRLQGPYVKHIVTTDWVASGADFHIVITPKQHRRGANPTPSFYIPSPNGGEDEAFLDKNISVAGTVTIGVSRPCEGTLKIR